MLLGMRTISYGPLPDQVGDLYLPDSGRPAGRLPAAWGILALPWGRDHIAPIAADLARRGFAVWNLEYRRGAAGGWPATFEDVGAGIDHLAELAERGVSFDLNRVTVVGHSAGGHLALWSAWRARDEGSDGGHHQPKRVRISAAVGLAPVADLRLAYELRCGGGAVESFLGGSPEQVPAAIARRRPPRCCRWASRNCSSTGARDEDVPIEISRSLSPAAAAAGDEACLIELADAAHMDFVDPATEAHATLCRRLSLQEHGR